MEKSTSHVIPIPQSRERNLALGWGPRSPISRARFLAKFTLSERTTEILRSAQNDSERAWSDTGLVLGRVTGSNSFTGWKPFRTSGGRAALGCYPPATFTAPLSHAPEHYTPFGGKIQPPCLSLSPKRNPAFLGNSSACLRGTYIAIDRPTKAIGWRCTCTRISYPSGGPQS